MARGYFRILVFACTLMVGVQFPAVMDQYRKRVDAHFREISINLSGFQQTADRYFDGSLEALISHYKKSPDPVFAQDAQSVEQLHRRCQMLSAQQSAMSGPWYRAGFHLLFFHNDEILAETFDQYSYTVPLSPRAIAWGLGAAFFVSLLLELIVIGIFKGFWLAVKPRHSGALCI
ncbi:MAG: DUF2937 family protein [Desulfosalsimonas sp.]|uniref:DUF2937 family protein n=1 Tax=Desulfosalsimonas sp. TaxID=3073848 RepID=UPI00397052A2